MRAAHGGEVKITPAEDSAGNEGPIQLDMTATTAGNLLLLTKVMRVSVEPFEAQASFIVRRGEERLIYTVFVVVGRIQAEMKVFDMRYALLVVAIMFLSGGVCDGQELDAQDVVTRLMARQGSLKEGTIQFEQYEFLTSPEYYDEIAAAADAFEKGGKEEAFALIRKAITAPHPTKPSWGYKGAFYYRDGKYRLKRQKIQDFGSDEALKSRAREAGGIPAGMAPEMEEVVFDGENLRILAEGDRLTLRDKSSLPNYPRIGEFDISTEPWRMMLLKGANPGQTITTSLRNGRAVIRFENQLSEGQTSWVDYEFDLERAYAPARVHGEKKGARFLNVLYGYDSDARDNCPRPCFTASATFKSEGYVTVDMRLIQSWSDAVTDADLELSLPAKYTVFDMRFGNAPLVYDEAGAQREDFKAPAPTPFPVEKQDTMDKKDNAPPAGRIVKEPSRLGNETPEKGPRYWLITIAVVVIAAISYCVYKLMRRKT